MDLLQQFGLSFDQPGTFAGEFLSSKDSEILTVTSPIDDRVLANVRTTSDHDYDSVIKRSQSDFEKFRVLPAPKRGEIVREIGDELRKNKDALARLVTLEMGKIFVESAGEVQEAIDICDFSVGLSRQLYGLTMHSERPQHRMYEQWHPLGPIGVITAFNFPIAVWSWNAIIGAVCGNSVVWKPSELTPLTALATASLCSRVTGKWGFPALFSVVTGTGPAAGQRLAADKRLPLISATGSTAMGRAVGQAVAARLGRSLLELSGNNAITVLPDANMELAMQAIVFGAAGTTGQRCTTTRRLFLAKEILEPFTAKLVEIYKKLPVGNPLEPSALIGPLVHPRAVEQYTAALARVSKEGGKVLCGGKVLEGLPSKNYVEPAIVLANRKMPLVAEETFAPILYVIPVSGVDEAIAANNEVNQGLSSAIFTRDLQAAERFLSHAGSDCGIANVNIGTSGAEIGGAFGGEKETGGGRESGSDSWKNYMRRQTSTINWGNELPLAQGIVFGN